MQIERSWDIPHHIVHRGKIQVVEEIETLSHNLDRTALVQPDMAREAYVEGPETGTDTRIASGERRPVRGRVAIRVEIGSRQQVERPRTVGPEDRVEREIPKQRCGPAGRL